MENANRAVESLQPVWIEVVIAELHQASLLTTQHGAQQLGRGNLTSASVIMSTQEGTGRTQIQWCPLWLHYVGYTRKALKRVGHNVQWKVIWFLFFWVQDWSLSRSRCCAVGLNVVEAEWCDYIRVYRHGHGHGHVGWLSSVGHAP